MNTLSTGVGAGVGAREHNDAKPNLLHPAIKPVDPRFSSGPCRKHPGWNLSSLDTSYLGRSHRAKEPKQRLQSAIIRSANLLGLPPHWQLAIVPGSDTGAVEMALWSLIGPRAVDVFAWDAFSTDWATDLTALEPPDLRIHRAEPGQISALHLADSDADIVFAYNGTTTGVRVPDLDWIADERAGLVICDATSAAFAMELDFSKLDVVTWSWQKVLGGEAAHGMLALSPRAVDRIENMPSPRALPKLFTLSKKNKLNDALFSGSTINTPSLLAVEDLHSALDWAERIGGAPALQQRTQDNVDIVAAWVQDQDWIDWLAQDPLTRSTTSLCLRITQPAFQTLPLERQQYWVNQMVSWLAQNQVAFDIANYRSAPPGFRIWAGPTIERDDFPPLLEWLEWAFESAAQLINEEEKSHD